MSPQPGKVTVAVVRCGEFGDGARFVTATVSLSATLCFFGASIGSGRWLSRADGGPGGPVGGPLYIFLSGMAAR